MTRRVFYSFHYQPDVVRVSQVRNIGSLETNPAATANEWEEIISGSDISIKRWITQQMKNRTCTVVLVGEDTANRKWINHEIIKSWDEGMGVVGIHIHGLKDFGRNTSKKGKNPFDYIEYANTGKKLSSLVKCYDPGGSDSKKVYAWIAKYLESAIEEAIEIRSKY